jgi:uncharacterized protein
VIESEHYKKALDEADATYCDDALVLEHLRTAESEGDERAVYALAQCYRHGTFGLKVDLKMAHDLNKGLESSNIAEAIFNLAVDYDCGNFVRTNPKRAFSLYLVAALLGDPESCSQIAQAYQIGWVVSQNRRLAKAWKLRSKCNAKLISPPYRRWLR